MSKELAQALGIEPYQLELWGKLTALFSARRLQAQDEIAQFSAEVGRIVGERLAIGDKTILPWLTRAEEVQSDWLTQSKAAEKFKLPEPPLPQIPTPRGKPPPTRPASIMAGLNMYESEMRKLWQALGKKPVAPTVAELLAYLNSKRESLGLPLISKADVSEACQALPSLKKRIASARRGRPRKA